MVTVLLFDGSCSAGKSTITKALSKATGIPRIEGDPILNCMKRNYLDTEDEIIKRLERSSTEIVILDYFYDVGTRIEIEGHDLINILVYTPPSKLAAHYNTRDDSRRHKSVLRTFSKIYKKVKPGSGNCLDTINVNDFFKVLKINRWKKGKMKYMKYIHRQFGTHKACIEPINKHHITIKTAHTTPEQAVDQIIKKLHIIPLKKHLIRDHGVTSKGMSKEFDKWYPKFGPWPKLYTFTGHSRTLRFIAAHHTTDLKSDTFALVKQAVSEPTDLLIVEGLPLHLGIDNSKIKEDFKIHPTPSEVQYAVNLAIQHKIPFTGVEPNRKDQEAYLKEKGFTNDDLLGYQYVLMTPQNKRHKLTHQQHKEWFYKRFPKFDAEKWYSDKVGKPFDYDKITNNDAGPAMDGTIINKMSATTDLFREKIVLLNTLAMFRKYRNIVMVYGANHSYAQFPVWKDLFTLKI